MKMTMVMTVAMTQACEEEEEEEEDDDDDDDEDDDGEDEYDNDDDDVVDAAEKRLWRIYRTSIENHRTSIENLSNINRPPNLDR